MAQMNDWVGAAFDEEVITVSNTALGFTEATAAPSKGLPSMPCWADAAYLTVEGDAVRYYISGATPTATVGHPLAVGEDLLVVGRTNVSQFRMIRQTTDATVTVTYLRA